MKKLAFCFLIYDVINFEEIWNKLFEGIDENKYNIYIHYKVQKPLKYFEKYKLKDTINTKYGDISLVNASNLLFKTAYEDDKENYKFILVSQACIPVKYFDYIYDFLTKDDYGHINLNLWKSNSKSEKMKFYGYNKLAERIPRKFIEKGSQWLILNRQLVWILAIKYDKHINKIFDGVSAPDEIYYGTFSNIYGILNKFKVYDEEDPRYLTTFANWNNNNYEFYDINLQGLKNYSSISKAEMDSILKKHCLFARKFNPGCKFEDSDENFILYVSDRIKAKEQKGKKLKVLYFILLLALILIIFFVYKKRKN